MGKLAKTIGYTFVGLVGLSILTNMIKPEEPVKEIQPKTEQAAPKKEEPKKADPAPTRPTGDKGVTEENYNKIVQGDYTGEGGMGKTEVFDMLGNADTFTTSKVNNDTIESASWNTKDYKTMIMITFMNGKVSSKTITKL